MDRHDSVMQRDVYVVCTHDPIRHAGTHVCHLMAGRDQRFGVGTSHTTAAPALVERQNYCVHWDDRIRGAPLAPEAKAPEMSRIVI